MIGRGMPGGLALRLPAHRASSATLAGAYPFLVAPSCSVGVLVGTDALTGEPFCFDPWDLYAAGLLTNPNVLLAGVIGQGKSALAKPLALRSIAAGRPFPMFTQLFSQLSTAWLGLTDDERSDAFFRPFGDAAFEEYARRYGFEFVPSPDDRYGELSAICRRRLVNSAASERHSASENHLRLIENKLSDMIENIQAR